MLKSCISPDWTPKPLDHHLADLYRQLPFTGEGLVDVKSDDGLKACESLLNELEAVAETLRVPMARRAYLESFSSNYKAILGQKVRYNKDVLKAAVDWQRVIWVNGDSYTFSAEAERCAGVLNRCWVELLGLLHRHCWTSNTSLPHLFCQVVAPTRSEFRSALEAMLKEFDKRWVNFEMLYIGELIRIEAGARQIVVTASDLAAQLQAMENESGEAAHSPALLRSPKYHEVLCSFIKVVGKLNSVANTQGKGRDDLGVEALKLAVMEQNYAESNQDAEQSRAFALMLADEAESAWMSLRNHLQQARQKLELVNPQLSQDAPLVSRLGVWEESWTNALRYLGDKMMCEELCSLVFDLKGAEDIIPEFVRMCEECAPELVMVMPRLVLIHFLLDPPRRQGVMRKLLPKHFPRQEGREVHSGAVNMSEDLTLLCERFATLRTALLDLSTPKARSTSRHPRTSQGKEGQERARQCHGGSEHCPLSAYERRRQEQSLWKALVYCLFNGPNFKSRRVEMAVKEFIKELEQWSMELQRHCPEDWNRCCQLIVEACAGVDDE